MKYMFLLHWDASDPVAESDPRMDGIMAEHIAVTRDAIARGAYVTCDALQGAATATTVRVRDGKTLTTDGPFAETKEVLGGVYILDCKDLDEALEFAARIPDAKYGCVEVRPIATIPGWDEAVGLPQAAAR